MPERLECLKKSRKVIQGRVQVGCIICYADKHPSRNKIYVASHVHVFTSIIVHVSAYYTSVVV